MRQVVRRAGRQAGRSRSSDSQVEEDRLGALRGCHRACEQCAHEVRGDSHNGCTRGRADHQAILALMLSSFD